jgi:hypothetical protein
LVDWQIGISGLVFLCNNASLFTALSGHEYQAETVADVIG